MIRSYFFFLKYGVDINVKIKGGKIVYVYVICRGFIEISDYLEVKGVDIVFNIVD